MKNNISKERNTASDSPKTSTDKKVVKNDKKENYFEELLLANIEKDRRADELVLANKELEFQNIEKDKRADELALANIEKDKRADELLLANIEKDRRANELILANKELEFQNIEKDKRAEELVLANIEKDSRAEELLFANIEKDRRADELILANQELEYQNIEKDKRANELLLANLEIDSRANELILANKDKAKQKGALTNFREKSRFFATMSHEMRTPLNGILSAIQLLNDGQLNSGQQKFLDAARISGEILLGHINNVLIIERNDNNDLKPCDILKLTSDILTTMTPLATASKHVICLDNKGLDNRKIITDSRAIQQILMNLISNAIKFSASGDIKLRVFYGQFDDGKIALHLEVSDCGLGISPKDIERIFDDFVVLDNSYERHASGTGLGLGIIRTLVQRLGGDIKCESKIGHGSKFIVRLIVVQTEENKLALVASELPLLAPLQLLVVDDNEINRVLLKAMLKRLGHNVTLAEGGHEALALALKFKFDAILMDISMPKMNGLQATKAILTGDGPNQTTPIIAVTAHALPEEQNEYVKAGMLGFIEKPVNLSLLKKMLMSKCFTYSSSSTLKLQRTESKTCSVEPLLNESRLFELLDIIGHNNLSDLINAMIKQFEDEIPVLIETRVLLDIGSTSHTMAGVCSNLGVERLYCLLNEIQAACKDGDLPRARGLVKLLPSAWQETNVALQRFFKFN